MAEKICLLKKRGSSSGGTPSAILSGEMFNPYSASAFITHPAQNTSVLTFGQSYTNDTDFIYTYVKNGTSTIKSTNGGTYLVCYRIRDATTHSINIVTVNPGDVLLSIPPGTDYYYHIIKM